MLGSSIGVEKNVFSALAGVLFPQVLAGCGSIVTEKLVDTSSFKQLGADRLLDRSLVG